MLDEATAACRGVHSLQAELAISGRAGGEKIRGRVLAGFELAGRMRLEAVAPFGAPAFILVSQGGSATLLMPRDERILRDAPPDAVIEALTGVSVSPDDLLATLDGCVRADRKPSAARTYADGWAAIELADGTTIYLRRQERGWRIAAATRAGLTIEYGGQVAAGPSRVRLRVAASDGSVTTDLAVSLSQVETNTAIDPRAFSLKPPDKAVPLTLDELRRAGPLGQRR